MTTPNTRNIVGWARYNTSPTFRGSDPFNSNVTVISGAITQTMAAMSQAGSAIVGVLASFQLPVGNFMPARMPLNLIYPRPDGETGSYARHKFMHSVMPYRVPIGIQGGAYPFNYEITTAPSGSTIGAGYADADYGILTVPPQASGTHPITIKVTDQDGSVVNVSWNATVQDSKFTFIQDGYAGTKVGTITQPLEDLNDWYKGDQNDSTYADQIIVLRTGNYLLVGDATNEAANLSLNAGTKTLSLIGYPQELSDVDCSGAKFFTRNGTSQSDLFVSGIKFSNSRQDVTNAHFFWCTSTPNRLTFSEVHFYNHGSGSVGNDNTCAVFVSARNGLKNYAMIRTSVFDTFTNNSSNGSYSDMYDMSNVLIELNTANDSTASYGWWCKGTTANVSIRANKAVVNCAGRQATIGYGSESAAIPHDHEICWNQFALNIDNPNIITWATSNAYGGQTYNSYIYRNTFYRGKPEVRFPGLENFETDSNVIVSQSLPSWDTSLMTTVFPNVLGATSEGITDTSGVLIGQSRIDYLGTKGHEVSA